MAIVNRSSRQWTIKPADNGNICDMGPAATSQSVGVFSIQFIPDAEFVGQVSVQARCMGYAAQDSDAAFATVPYRRVNVNGVASDRALVTTVITGPGMIEVPSNGWSVGLLVACSAGTCDVVSWPLAGPAT